MKSRSRSGSPTQVSPRVLGKADGHVECNGSVAGIDAQGLFGPLTKNLESVESHRRLLYSLGSHLESLSGLLVNCGRAQQEDLNGVGEDLAAFIAKSEWRDLAPAFVRMPLKSGPAPSSPSAACANKQYLSLPKLPPSPRTLNGMSEDSRIRKDDGAPWAVSLSPPLQEKNTDNIIFDAECTGSSINGTKKAVVSMEAEHVEFLKNHRESQGDRTADCSENVGDKYKADYSIYAKTKSKSRMSRLTVRENKQDEATTQGCRFADEATTQTTTQGCRLQDDLHHSLDRFGTHEFSLSGIAEGTVGVVILINAFVMGVSEDIKWQGWEILEYFFTAFFLCEMIMKMYRTSIWDYFYGRDKYWNRFDCFIVIIAVIDSAMTIYLRATQGEDGTDLGRFAQIKIIRIGRLGRLIRLLRFKIFGELKHMIEGVFAGLKVLFWAVVLLFSFIYLVAIIGVSLIGEDENPLIRESFGRVPWAMLTLFMCFTDACTASDGTPLPYHLFNRYGVRFMASYMLGALFVIIGLFNLIMAIFVDNVMESKRIRRHDERAMDRSKAETQLRRVIRHCLYDQCKNGENHGFATVGCDKHGRKSANFEHISLTREMFCQVLCDRRMERVLDLLDVETCNRVELFDVLDSDMSGELDLEEVIAGLLSLRGPSEKKDAVGAFLCGRMTQQLIKDFRDYVEAQCHQIRLEQQQLTHFLADGVIPSQNIIIL